MRAQFEERLQELQAERTRGQQLLADLENQRADVIRTLLRIGGAIQVIEEELAKASPAEEAHPEAALTDNGVHV